MRRDALYNSSSGSLPCSQIYQFRFRRKQSIKIDFFAALHSTAATFWQDFLRAPATRCPTIYGDSLYWLFTKDGHETDLLSISMLAP